MPESVKKPKNIVICCDGTGNRFGNTNSNVVKLYTCLIVDGEQVAYYHPGLGTMGDPNKSTWVGRQTSKIAGLAFGRGFRANMADAYRFLMSVYSNGDRVFLFGFSRGAYTVRALAGALYMYGLLCPGNEGHLPYLLEMFSDESRRAFSSEGEKRLKVTQLSEAFRETFSRSIAIHFIGVWDTVSSIGWIYDPVKLLFDGQNPIVRKGRHAISVDEHRCFFQDSLWGPPLPPGETPVLREASVRGNEQQDIVQTWFAGVHSDVGGSYLQSECAPAMDALKWILDEAEADGLLIHQRKREAIFGLPSSEHTALESMYPAVISALHCLHNSLTWKWWIFECFPHKYHDASGKKHWRFLPWAHRRELPDGAILHPSLRRRLNEDASYKPKNLSTSSIYDFSESPVPLPQSEVMAQLQAQRFGVYRRSAPAGRFVPRKSEGNSALPIPDPFNPSPPSSLPPPTKWTTSSRSSP